MRCKILQAKAREREYINILSRALEAYLSKHSEADKRRREKKSGPGIRVKRIPRRCGTARKKERRRPWPGPHGGERGTWLLCVSSHYNAGKQLCIIRDSPNREAVSACLRDVSCGARRGLLLVARRSRGPIYIARRETERKRESRCELCGKNNKGTRGDGYLANLVTEKGEAWRLKLRRNARDPPLVSFFAFRLRLCLSPFERKIINRFLDCNFTRDQI